MDQIFKGIKVVELAGVLAGPMAGMYFAELGAEVIKVENPKTGGDVTRSWKLTSEDKEARVSAYFSSVNYRKKYLFLDLSQSDHINEVYREIKDADIVISNYKEGDDYKFGLDYERLKTINPGLIHAQLNGFDSDPGRVAYDVVVQAETGYMFMNGDKSSGPLKMPLALMDILAAHQLKEAILTALWLREKDGKGRQINCSLEASALGALANQASNYLMCDHIPQAIGSLHPNIAPYGETFSCKDSKLIVLAIGTDKQFAKLCTFLGDEHIAKDERFLNNPSRVENRDELYDVLRPLFKSRERKEILDECIAQNIPLGAVRSMDEVFETSQASKMIRQEDIDGIPTQRLSTVAFEIKS